MQRIFIFLSISIFFILLHYSNGAPRKIRPVENDEYDNVMKKIVNKLKRYVDESSSIESDSESNEEEKKFADQIKYIEKSEESNSNSNEEDDDIDKEDISSHFTDIGHDKVSQDSDKN